MPSTQTFELTRTPIVAISATPIDVAQLRRLVDTPLAGAVASFDGIVRNRDHGRAVTTLEYSAHPSAASILTELVNRVLRDHPAVASLVMVHRVGRLIVGDTAIFCAAAAPHRRAAFSACADAVEVVKHELPVWKRQQFADGDYEWVNSG